MARWTTTKTATHLIVTLVIHVLLAMESAGQGKGFQRKVIPILALNCKRKELRIFRTNILTSQGLTDSH